jgi:hypothetical protein
MVSHGIVHRRVAPEDHRQDNLAITEIDKKIAQVRAKVQIKDDQTF